VQDRDLGWVSKLGDTRPRIQGNRQDEGERSAQYRPFGYGIAGLMEERGLSGQRLGVDALETEGVLALQEAGVRVADASFIMEYAGAVKTDDEVAIYRTIGKQYEHTIKAFRDAIRSGITENEL